MWSARSTVYQLNSRCEIKTCCSVANCMADKKVKSKKVSRLAMKTRQTLLFYGILIGASLFLVYFLTMDKISSRAVELESHVSKLGLVGRQSRIGLRHPNSYESPRERYNYSYLSMCKL